MPTTYTQAPTFTAGEIITAAEHIQQANAINSRLTGGPGDPTYRIHQYAARLTRRTRVGDQFVVPATNEFLETYLHVNPAETEYTWPESEPGTAGDSANLACPAMAFVLGNPWTEAEGNRLNVMAMVGDTADLRQKWLTGKQQRGTYDPATGVYAAPAFEAARSHYSIMIPATTGITDYFGTYSGTFHGKSYGGYLPAPEVVGNCGFPNFNSNQYRIKFTNLVTGEVRTWLTACPGATDASLVAWVTAGAGVYRITFADGSSTTMDRKTWIEGPYTGGGRLQKAQGEGVARLMLHQYIADYRGTATQRQQSGWSVEDSAFLTEEFLSRQYYLAPAKVGAYPSWEFTGSLTISAGETGTAYQVAEDFTAGLIYLAASGLQGTASVEILNGSDVVETVTLTESAPTVIRTYPDAWTPNLNFRLATDATFTSTSGSIYIELAEILEYKPEEFDAYLVLRIGTAEANPSRVDGEGRITPYARDVWDAYAAAGCATNHNAAGGVEAQTIAVNNNPVFECMRKAMRKWLRVFNRLQLLNYEVEDGKSVLTLKRFVAIDGDLYDAMDGIADAIAEDAPEQGESNEWCMFMQIFPFSDSDSSLWKLSALADIYTFNNPAHWYTSELNSYGDLSRHFNEGPPYPPLQIAPEAASAYNYAEGTNRLDIYTNLTAEQREGFYRSREIYRPDYQVESATTSQDGEAVRLVFKTRFQHCDDAPASVGLNVGSWDIAALDAEPYRTDENALRQWLVYISTGHKPPVKIGDHAASSFIDFATDAPYGTVVPRLFFTKLVTKPYEEPTPNSTAETHDTFITFDRFAQMEFYLRAMCEGFIDGQTTISYAGESTDEFSPLWDFTFENLCYRAFGGRSICNVPPSVRDDMPQGFGPLPTNFVYAEGLNQISACINLLTKARVCMPFVTEWRQDLYTGAGTVAPDWPASPTNVMIAFDGDLPAATTYIGGDAPDYWNQGDILAAVTTGNPNGDTSGSDWVTVSARNVVSYRMRVSSDEQLLALHEDLRGYLSSPRFIGAVSTQIATTNAIEVATREESASIADNDHAYWDGSTGYRFEVLPVPSLVYQELSTGTLDAGETPPSSDLAYGTNGVDEDIPGRGTRYVSLTKIRLSEAFIEIPSS